MHIVCVRMYIAGQKTLLVNYSSDPSYDILVKNIDLGARDNWKHLLVFRIY